MQTDRSAELSWIDNLVLPIFITTVVIYSLSVICVLFSIINVCCVLKTQERKYKNVAHISWISAFTMMIVGSLSACFYTLVSVLSYDHCVILDITETKENVAGVPNIYPTDVVPLLNTCMFDDVKNAGTNLGSYAQMESLEALNKTSADFLTASDSLTWDNSVWADYYAQINVWRKRISLLEFTESEA